MIKHSDGSGGPKKCKKWPKNEVFWVLTKIMLLCALFLLENKSTNGLQTFCKIKMSGKNLVIGLRSKTSRPIRTQGNLDEVEFLYVLRHS